MKQPVKKITITLPAHLVDERVPFLLQISKIKDRTELMQKALEMFDRLLCARSEGAEVYIRSKTGIPEDFSYD